MRRKKLVWRLFATNFVIALLAVVTMSAFAVVAFSEFYCSETERNLEARARIVARQIEEQQIVTEVPRLAGLAESVDDCSGTRVTVIARDGTVLADSRKAAWLMENHSDRPEFLAAMDGRVAASRRRSPTLGSVMIYAAAPIRTSGIVVGAARVSVEANVADAASKSVSNKIALAAVLIVLLAASASLLTARRIRRPLAGIQDAASRFAQGDLGAKAPMSDIEEFADLAQSLNWMASEIDHQVHAISKEVREQEAIMQSMKEGVLAVGPDDLTILLNPAAEELLGITASQCVGKPLQEVVRNPALLRLFEDTSRAETPLTAEIVVRGEQERIVQVAAAPLVDPSGSAGGVVAVLNDISQTRKLENIRRDFVANVSHELKTPITAIKGFIEALREGAADDPAKAGDFLEIVARHADRLNAIVDDLLSLARIEQSMDSAEIELLTLPVCPVLEAARANCGPRAADAGVSIKISCDPALSASINAPLLEQAVTNLVDNAVKYSRKGGQVMLTAEMTAGEVAISVVDRGQGIEPHHIPRIFERFYRADKSRSRKDGGTGLGLAIVKHIVQAHRGRVEVKSLPGKGSTFTILVPVD